MNFFSFSGVMPGNRTRLTFMSRTETWRASRSTETRAAKKMTPNFGAVAPCFVKETAARPVTRSPWKVSACGWYIDDRVALGRRELPGPLGNGSLSDERARPRERQEHDESRD